ncbi:hypothetical protein BCV70DRAFT_157231 [Testicularia cyperi]|uniref:Uncharacterized protein n=1 Tax=Testicularia cyperi TaxID=1882483 RepID=A0A317XVR5_9BASI|nr:hypothetical protein BCV70DRAFT_157231 [Testicularia cyperi]
MNLDPAAAAAAAAAYGHLGFNGSASVPNSRRPSQMDGEQRPGVPSNGSLAGQWGPSGPSMGGMGDFGPGAMPHTNTVPLRAPSLANVRTQANGYEGDGSSSNSSEDSAGGKKRRMTFTGAPINTIGGQMGMGMKPMLLHSDSNVSGISDLQGVGPNPMMTYGGPDMQQAQQQQQHQQHGLPNQMESLTRPPFRHRRSRSGSEVAGPGFGVRAYSSFDSASGLQSFNANNGGFAPPPSGPYPTGQTQSHSFVGSQPLSSLGGHAASHPPGLGSQILRGVDVSASGSSAASDFTKRKGWTGRVVEELLDFVHVLDPEGTILFASPSVFGLTGWKSEELRGHKLTEFIHPQDAASVEREIDRMRSSKGELLTYYRFRTKPQSNLSKGGEKASSNDNDSSAGDTAEDKQSERRNEAEHAEAFTRDGDYIVFEATGHPYFPPEPSNSSSSGNGDGNGEDGEGKTNEADGIAGKDKDAQDGKTESTAAKVKTEKMLATLSESKTGSHPLSQSQSMQTPTSEATSSSRAQLQCFFCSARPYPSKNTSMLDSFLELKLENEKLRLLIADMDLTGPDGESDRAHFAPAYHPDLLKQELEDDGSGGPWRPSINPMFGPATMGPDGRLMSTSSMPRPSAHPSRQNSHSSHPTSPVMRNGSRDDMLAGLGVSTQEESDDESGSQGHAGAGGAGGVGGVLDDARRKKKPKQDDGDHVCTDCGRVDSPEWRKGPLGPKTLCNACGLRWAKKIKRKGGDPNLAAGGGGGGAMLMGGGPSGMPQHMMPPHGHPVPHGHPHPFVRADSGPMQAIPMAPPGSMPPGMGMGGMMAGSPPGFASRPSFDDSQQGGHGGPGMHM